MQILLKTLFRIEAIVASVAYVVVVVAMLTDIIAREFFNASFIYTSKLALFAAIFAGMLGLGLATASGTHIRPRFADLWVPHSWQNQLQRLGDLLSASLFSFAGYISYELVHSSYEIGFLVPVVDWPLWWFQIIMPYAFISNALRHLAFAIHPALKPKEEVVE